MLKCKKRRAAAWGRQQLCRQRCRQGHRAQELAVVSRDHPCHPPASHGSFSVLPLGVLCTLSTQRVLRGDKH